MEATLDEQMLGRCAEDGDNLVIPGWLKSLNHCVDRNIYFCDKRIPEAEAEAEADKDVVVVEADKKVELHPDDALFQQQLGDAQVPCTKVHNYPQSAIDALARGVVVGLLCNQSASWVILRQKCLAANDQLLYHRSIEAGASLVFMIFNKLSLFRYGHARTVHKQLDALLKQVLTKGGPKSCPDYEVFKLIAELVADEKKYSLVTEVNLAEMLTYFPRSVPPDLDGDKGPVFEDISKVVRAMKQSSLPRLKADEQTRLLINFLKKESHENINGLVCGVMVMVKPDAVERLEQGDDILVCLWVLLLGLSTCIRLMLQGQLSRVTAPLFELSDPPFCHISSEILDIVEVAELRRMALGSRFIRRSYLIWAIYELGFGLPPKICTAIKNTLHDEDVPPYHVYVTAKKLVEYCGVGNMQLLKHFLYAVIFAKEDIDFDERVGFDARMDQYSDFLAVLEAAE